MSTTNHNQFVATALALPEADRAELASRLLASLDPPGNEVTATAFGEELHRRVAGFRDGSIDSLSLDEVRAATKSRTS